MDEAVYANLETQFSTPRLQLKKYKISAPPPRKMPCLKESCALQSNIRHVLKFATEEYDLLMKGITKHGFGQWTAVLSDRDFKLQDRKNSEFSEEKGSTSKYCWLDTRGTYNREETLT